MAAETNDLLARFRRVDEIPKQDHLAMPGESARRHRSRRLLQRHLLVVSVHRLLRVDREGTLAHARAAERDSDLGAVVLVERTEDLAALATVKLDVLELREDSTATRDDAAHPHERVEVHLSEVAEGVGRRELGDADVHLCVNTGVRGVVEEDDGERDLVKEGEHRGRRVGEEVGQDRLGVGEMQERHLKRLGVHCAPSVKSRRRAGGGVEPSPSWRTRWP